MEEKYFKMQGLLKKSIKKPNAWLAQQIGLCKKCEEKIQVYQQEEFSQSKNDEQFTSVSLIKEKLLDMIDDSADRLLVNCCIKYFQK